MRKRMISALLSFMMVFSMTAPSFAEVYTPASASNNTTLNMVFFGDSVGAGFGLGKERGEYEFCKFDNDVYKNERLTAVKDSYPYHVATKLDQVVEVADKFDGIEEKYSYNGAYDGERPKDMCYALGLLNKYEEAESYTNLLKVKYSDATEEWKLYRTIFGRTKQVKYDVTSVEPERLKEKERGSGLYTIGDESFEFKSNKLVIVSGDSEKRYSIYGYKKNGHYVYFADMREPISQSFNPIVGGYMQATRWVDKMKQDERLPIAIEKADVISVQLGLNDFSALMMNDGDEFAEALGELLEPLFNNKTALSSSQKQALKEYQAAEKEFKDATEGSEEQQEALKEMMIRAMQTGVDLLKAFLKLNSIFMKHVNESNKYLTRLVNHLREVNSDAKIVIVNMYNPMKGWGLDRTDEEQAILAQLVDIFSIAMQPYLNRMNSNVANLAKNNNCVVADISKTVTAGPIDPWFLHPDMAGYEKIADTILVSLSKYKLFTAWILKIQEKIRDKKADTDSDNKSDEDSAENPDESPADDESHPEETLPEAEVTEVPNSIEEQTPVE